MAQTEKKDTLKIQWMCKRVILTADITLKVQSSYPNKKLIINLKKGKSLQYTQCLHGIGVDAT